MVVKSTYANMHRIEGTPYRDVKLKELITQNDYYRMQSVECFSIYDQAWNRGVKSYLERTFTEKSKWEL